MTYPIAAAHAGIDHDTLRIWRRKGERGQEPYANFVRALAQAELDWEVNAVKSIHAAGEKDFRAHEWLLERRLPQRYGRVSHETAQATGQSFEIHIHLSGDSADVHTAIALPPAIDVTPRPKDPERSTGL